MTPFYLLLALAAVVSMAGVSIRRSKPTPSAVLIGVGAALALAAIGWNVFVNVLDGGQRKTDRFHSAVGYVMANRAIPSLAGKKGVVCMLMPKDSATTPEANDGLYEAFARVMLPLGLEFKEAIVETNARKLGSGTIPLEAFEEAAGQVPGAIAYVSFAGAPAGFEGSSMLKNSAPVFIFDPAGSANWEPALKAGKVAFVVVPKAAQDANAPVSGPPEQIFKAHFEVVTPQSPKP